MDDAFSRSLDEWTAYYALMGGAAATLLGLLFVSLSLRLNIFHQHEVADIRAFAGFAFGTFLMGIAVPGLALAPHEHGDSLAATMLLAAIAGLGGVGRFAVLWTRSNPLAPDSPASARSAWQGRGYGLLMAAPYLGLVIVAGLIWRGHPAALGWLAVVEGMLLALGTGAAWLILSHAATSSDAP